MSRPHDLKMQRLFVRAGLSGGATISLDRAQVNYLVNVLRLKDGDEILVFNGRDGEWRAKLTSETRRSHSLVAQAQVRPQPVASDLHYLFAPLKQARLDYMVEKAVEMGAGRLRPVLTQHGQVTRVNRERLEAHVIEAAEQCGILAIPVIDQAVKLHDLLAEWEQREGTRRIIFCDEGHPHNDPLATLLKVRSTPVAALIGPEGGFSEEERRMLLSWPFVTAIPLGPRILRADTAAVAALALVQAALGDWKDGTRDPN